MLFADAQEADDVTGHTQRHQTTTNENSRPLLTHGNGINKQMVSASALEVCRLKEAARVVTAANSEPD